MAPCDSTRPGGLDEPPVEVGVRVETRNDAATYTYTVLNRSDYTLSVFQIGYNPETERCELTGARPHALPDATYSPTGWDCAPRQGKKDRKTFSIGWSPTGADSGSIAPHSTLSGFVVVLPQRDPLYEHCNFMIRIRDMPRMSAGGAVRPEGELDVVSDATGSVSGRVTDDHGAGIAGANIYVYGTDYGALTGSDGAYTIRKVLVGGHSFQARVMGFDPCDRAHVRVAAGRTTRVDFRLVAANPPTPCVPLTVARDRIRLPFPGNAVDTVGARFLDRNTPIPPRSSRERSRSTAFVYSLTSHDITFSYRGLDPDTSRRAFVATVYRTFSSPDEERLIRIAEETYPPPEAITPIFEFRHGKQDLSKEKRLWWFGEFDGVRLPYAVTMDAVRYYLALTQALGKGYTGQTHGIRMKSSRFSYHARISPRTGTYSRDGRVFKDVYVVEMGLSWSNYCGSLCACDFNLDRTVVLARDGTVLCVFGDRKPAVAVS